jgi:hypothetical protein
MLRALIDRHDRDVEWNTIHEICARAHPDGADAMDRFREWRQAQGFRYWTDPRAFGVWLRTELVRRLVPESEPRS